MHDLRNVGGTQGGLSWFLGGLAMLSVGVYLLFQQVDVHGGYWRWGGWGGGSSFGLTLVPMLVGVGWLFYDGASKAAWVVMSIGLLIVIAGIIANMEIHFRRTSLWNTLLILALIAGGIGVIIRSLRPIPRGPDPEE